MVRDAVAQQDAQGQPRGLAMESMSSRGCGSIPVAYHMQQGG